MKNVNFKHSLAQLGSLSIFLSSTLLASQLPIKGNGNYIKQEVIGPTMQEIEETPNNVNYPQARRLNQEKIESEASRNQFPINGKREQTDQGSAEDNTASEGTEEDSQGDSSCPVNEKKNESQSDQGSSDESTQEGEVDGQESSKKKKNKREQNGSGSEEDSGSSQKEGNGGAKKEDKEDSMITKYVDFGGALEVEAFYSSFDKDTRRSQSDIVLEAAELDFEIKLVDWAKGLLSLEWEPEGSFRRRRGGDRVIVKEGFITLGATERFPPYVRAGRLFVPFTIATGAVVGDTLSVSDPLTIEIFETREDVIMVGTSWRDFQVAAYVFNGDTHRRRFPFDPCADPDPNDPDEFDDPGHIQQFGATIRWGFEKPDYAFSIGLDFISDVFDSENLSDAFPDALFASNYSPGIAAHIRYFRYGISFIAELDYTFNKTKFRVEEDVEFIDGECVPKFKCLNLKPMAWMFELGYVTTICGKKTYFAIDYSQSHDLQGEFPEHRFLATIGSWIYEDKVLLAFEYGHDLDYPKSEGGTGHAINRFIAQLAYEW